MLAFVIYYSETEKDGPQHMSSHNETILWQTGICVLMRDTVMTKDL